MWFGRENHWTDRDLIAVEAMQIYQDSLCGGCGHSVMHTHDKHNSGEFEVETALCLGCQAVADHAPKNPASGVQVYVASSMSEPSDDDEEDDDEPDD